jgi:hypothetical protein
MTQDFVPMPGRRADHIPLADTITGATTVGYVTVLTIPCYSGATIRVTNTHATATLYYKINAYLTPKTACAATVITAETDLAANTAATDIVISTPYAKVDVIIKYHSGAGTYQVDYLAF